MNSYKQKSRFQTNRSFSDSDIRPQDQLSRSEALKSQASRTPSSSEPLELKSSLRSCLKVKTLTESLKMRSSETSLAKGKDGCQFSFIEIRLYPYMLGDNPGGVTSGVPITIGWSHFHSEVVSIDDFEKVHHSTDREPAQKLDFIEREELLKRIGYSRSELKEAEMKTRKAKKERALNAMQPASKVKFQEGVEFVHRKFKRWIMRQPGDRIVYEQWVKHQIQVSQQEQVALGKVNQSSHISFSGRSA